MDNTRVFQGEVVLYEAEEAWRTVCHEQPVARAWLEGKETSKSLLSIHELTMRLCDASSVILNRLLHHSTSTNNLPESWLKSKVRKTGHYQAGAVSQGRSSRILQDELPQLKKRYWGQHLWPRGYFCASVGAVNEDTIRRYIENQQGDDLGENKITAPIEP